MYQSPQIRAQKSKYYTTTGLYRPFAMIDFLGFAVICGFMRCFAYCQLSKGIAMTKRLERLIGDYPKIQTIRARDYRKIDQKCDFLISGADLRNY
jgi:hypothetical protein